MPRANKIEHVFLYQVDYLPNNGSINITGRNLIGEDVELAGFEHLDSSSSRSAYKSIPGKWEEFQRVVTEAGIRHSVPIKRLLHIPDPGLGLCLKFPEDGY